MGPIILKSLEVVNTTTNLFLASGKNQAQHGAIRTGSREAGRLRTDLPVIKSNSHPKYHLAMYINLLYCLKF